MKNKYLCNFQKLASCISYFCHVCNLFSDCGSSAECCFVKCPFRDYDKADQGAVQVPIFFMMTIWLPFLYMQ